MPDTRPIGVFDSGVGGLSVLLKLKKLLPHENFVFLADQKHVPYGERSKKSLIGLAQRITKYFILENNIKMLVIACNTSTCYSLEALRKKFKLPIVGTVPAVKPASERTKTGVIAVISTPSTSKSAALAKLVHDHCGNTKVINIGCKNLENVVEGGGVDGIEAKVLLKKYLKSIKNSKADYLVLACTHYPFLRPIIKKTIGRKIELLDSGRAIAKRAQYILKNRQIANSSKKKGNIKYLTTGKSDNFARVASKLLRANITARRVAI